MKVNGKSRFKEPSTSEKGKALDQCFPSWRKRKPKFIVQYNLLQLLLFFAVNL